MRKRTEIKNKLLGLILLTLAGASFLLLEPGSASAADVKMKIVVANPSKAKAQKTDIKHYLPQEITTLKQIKDAADLEVDYDEAKALYFVYKNGVELQASEIKMYEIALEDVWVISEEKLADLRGNLAAIVGRLKDTPYAPAAEAIAVSVGQRLDDILKTQGDQNASRQQHIAYYRENLRTLKGIREDIDKLEKMLVTVGGPPNPELLEKSDINLKSPSTKTTWVIIFVIMIFIGILGITFYFTWQRQARITENIFTREQGSSFSDFKKEKEEKGGKT